MRILLLLILLSPAAWAQEATARMRWRTGTFGKRAPIRVPLNEAPPAGVKLPERPKLPAEIVEPGPKPLYGTIGLAGSRLVVIVEPDRFWFDRDFDGDLSRELPVKWFGDQTRYRNVHVRHGDGSLGWPDAAPFDAIIVAAGGPEVPASLKEQLAIGGRLVIPVGDFFQSLEVIEKKRNGSLKRDTITFVRFVPMTGEAEKE